MDTREFKVNDYIALKLEYVEGDIDVAPGWRTVIYVKGKRFKQCKYLLLNILVDDISSLRKKNKTSISCSWRDDYPWRIEGD